MAGASQTGLNFVCDEQDAFAPADRGCLTYKTLWRNQDARFALDRLE